MASCRSCGKTITRALTKTGRKNPMEVDERGLFVLRWDRNARDPEAVLASEATVQPSEPRYTSHFATCPDAAQHRRRYP